MPTFNQFLQLDYALVDTFNSGWLAPTDYQTYTNWTSSWLLNSTNTVSYPSFGLSDLPIGAFYESTSLANDPAPSIAASTPRLPNTLGQGLTEYGISTYDANFDGKLSGAELTNLRAWVDGNENGVAETGEVKTLTDAGLTEIREINYIYYAAGNATAAPATVTAPTKPGEAVTITRTNLAPSVPFSYYRTLRDTDNLYPVPGGFITWTASQIKINYNSNSYLIGTDGNDAFDISYYAAYDGTYFNLSLIVSFLGGNGDDTVGGSTRSDNIWGGIGNDALQSRSRRRELRANLAGRRSRQDRPPSRWAWRSPSRASPASAEPPNICCRRSCMRRRGGEQDDQNMSQIPLHILKMQEFSDKIFAG